jgi:hypothetical protein
VLGWRRRLGGAGGGQGNGATAFKIDRGAQSIEALLHNDQEQRWRGGCERCLSGPSGYGVQRTDRSSRRGNVPVFKIEHLFLAQLRVHSVDRKALLLSLSKQPYTLGSRVRVPALSFLHHAWSLDLSPIIAACFVYFFGRPPRPSRTLLAPLAAGGEQRRMVWSVTTS